MGSEERAERPSAAPARGGTPGAVRRRILWALALVVPLGLFIKYAPPAAFRHWGRWHGGAVAYEIFWALAAGWARPRARPWRVGVAVFAATCGIEFAQLWHPPWLQAVRRTLPGRMLLGTTFDRTDFPYYALGSAAGALLLAALAAPARKQGEFGAWQIAPGRYTRPPFRNEASRGSQ